jgi:glycine/D-amino acid oxidase-like deaminating enzyme
MGYEETAETSDEITREIARRTLAGAQRIFPDLHALTERDIKNAWSGRVSYTLDDYPFVERSLDGRLTTLPRPPTTATLWPSRSVNWLAISRLMPSWTAW